MTLEKEGTIGAYTLGSVRLVDGGTIGSGIVEGHWGDEENGSRMWSYIVRVKKVSSKSIDKGSVSWHLDLENV